MTEGDDAEMHDANEVTDPGFGGGGTAGRGAMALAVASTVAVALTASIAATGDM